MGLMVAGVARLTKDCELKYTNGGLAVCHFSVATDDKVKEGDSWVKRPSFWDVELWGKQAESLTQYLVKGKQIFLSGTQKKESWEKDGVKHERVKITANDIQLLSGGESKPTPKQVDANNPTPDFSDDVPF